MATFITSSITWAGKENLDYFLRPMFIGKAPHETQGIRVIPNIQSAQKLNYFGVASKMLKAYAKGFNAATGTTYTQRTINVYRLKAEAADDALDFYQTVFEQGLRKDDWNNLDETILKDIIIEIYRNAVASDVYRKFWLDDPYKETVSSGTQTGTADADYNSITDGGMWYKLFADASTTPSDTQIFRHAVTDGAVAQVDTVTLTGASGTCNVTVEGVAYLATFDTSIAVTSAAFVALHAAALLLRGIVLTGATTLIFTAAVAGTEHLPAAASAALTGDLTGTTANTTANTAPAALAAGESEDIFQALHVGADKVLKNTPAANKVFLVSDLVYENYMAYLESFSTERAQILLENGLSFYTYRGIPIIPLGWDVHLDADFAHVTGELYARPHRVIYTTTDNLVLGIDSMNQFNETKMWYNPDAEENRFRSKLVMGTQYVHNKLVAVAY
jgi:hypothetical protein